MKENIIVTKALQELQSAKDKAARIITAEIRDIVGRYAGEFTLNCTLVAGNGESSATLYNTPRYTMLGSQRVGDLGADNIITVYRALLDTIADIERENAK